MSVGVILSGLEGKSFSAEGVGEIGLEIDSVSGLSSESFLPV